jgi:predicted dehydrogenase
MLRIGLVGFGKWGKNYVRAAESTNLGKVTALYLRPESPAWTDPSANAFQKLSHLDDFDVDCAILASHPAATPELCEILIDRGVPLLIEKPAALSLTDAVRIHSAATRRNALLLVAHQHLFSNGFAEIKKRIAPADIESIHTFAGNLGPYRDYSALWDYGPHDIAMILSLMVDMPDSVSCKRQVYHTGESYQLQLNFRSDVYSRSEIWNHQLPKARKLIVRSGGKLFEYDDTRAEAKLCINGTPISIDYEPPLTIAVREFLRAVAQGGTQDARFGSIWAMQVVKILEIAVDRSLAVDQGFSG